MNLKNIFDFPGQSKDVGVKYRYAWCRAYFDKVYREISK